MRWTEALGREVVETSSAQVVGRVDAFVTDPSRARLTGVVVGQHVVDWSDAGGVGADAVTIAEADMLRPADTDADRAAVERGMGLLRSRVLTETGTALGQLDDIEFDPETGSIERLVLSETSVAGTHLLGVGSYAVVVSDPDGPSGDLASMTRDELYELAQERDVEGRSSMTKDELIDALR